MIEEFRISVVVPASVEVVWRELVSWERQGEWMAMTRVTASDLGADDSNVGTTIEAFTGIGKFGIVDQMRVTKWQPPTFCEVEHFGKFIKGIGEFKLSEISEGKTRFDWYEKIFAPKFLLILIKPAILSAVYLSLRKFARTF